MKYDDASWHYGGNFPPELPHENGATHIGMFLGWAILRGLVGDIHRADPLVAFDLDRVRARQLYPRDFFLNCCDEKLTDRDLNDVGNAFAANYYQEMYLTDWTDLFPDNYRVDDGWTNFEQVVALLDRRFGAWRDGLPDGSPTGPLRPPGLVLS